MYTHQTILAQNNICKYLTLLREIEAIKNSSSGLKWLLTIKKLLENTVNIFHEFVGTAVG